LYEHILRFQILESMIDSNEKSRQNRSGSGVDVDVEAAPNLPWHKPTNPPTPTSSIAPQQNNYGVVQVESVSGC
jgi:hypothetical protein